MEAQLNDNPNVLSSKHPHIVTRSDVEQALFLWVKHMEEKQETVNGLMLKERWKCFEEELDVPENEHVIGDGWIPSFCWAYKIKEYQWHGEADSVDLEAVEIEWQHVKKITDAYEEGHNNKYQSSNIWIKFFEPNMTPFVQPLDAGIILCFMAYYWQAFCRHAIELDEAGKSEINKINLLKAMVTAQQA
ncbi:hypothetical protein C0989_011374 [Termitomyces sp. Mn162]|nr:hypothetical protein C0989_011374 [Termitomyces sp. Mn162]